LGTDSPEQVICFPASFLYNAKPQDRDQLYGLKDSKERKTMKSTIALALLCLAAVSGNAQVKKPPVSNIELQRMGTAKKIVVVAPLQPEVKLNRVRSLLKGKVKPLTLNVSTLADPLVLSVASPVKDANNYLKLVLARQVSAIENLAAFEDEYPVGSPGVLVLFNAPADGYYVFDLTTTLPIAFPSSPVTLKFTGLTNGDNQQQTFSKDEGHVIFISEGFKAGPNLVFIGGDRAYWNFYSIDISQFKVSS
jgi:hypothetical protein